jgi:hypothetical protein
MSFIPKNADAMDIKDFRSISLVSGVYKRLVGSSRKDPYFGQS